MDSLKSFIMKWLTLYLVVTNSFFKITEASGVLEIFLKQYNNPEGLGRNGNCCDSFEHLFGVCLVGACDHIFLVCVDSQPGSSDMNVCPYGRKQTGAISDTNVITFGGDIGGTANPIVFKFKSWTQNIRIKVDVYDEDDNDNDEVDSLSATITAIPSATEQLVILVSRTRLEMTVKVYCDIMFHGPHCDVLCSPTDDTSGHYDCDATTGAKICHQGWNGTECNTSQVTYIPTTTVVAYRTTHGEPIYTPLAFGLPH